jgi:hypothetical protein
MQASLGRASACNLPARGTMLGRDGEGFSLSPPLVVAPKADTRDKETALASGRFASRWSIGVRRAGRQTLHRLVLLIGNRL